MGLSTELVYDKIPDIDREESHVPILLDSVDRQCKYEKTAPKFSP